MADESPVRSCAADEAGGRSSKKSHPWDAFFDAPAPEDGGPRGERRPYTSRLRDGAPWENDERLSHALGRVLRYHAEDAGLTPDSDGFVSLKELLNLPDFEGATEDDLLQVCTSSVGTRGRRFDVREAADAPETSTDGPAIRAAYKHTKDGSARSGLRESRRPRGEFAHRGLPPRVHRPNGGGGFSTLPPDEFDPDEDYPIRYPRRAEYVRTASSASASSAKVEHTEVEKWEMYKEPQTMRAWYWNTCTEETFFADDASSGWERFEDSSGAPWWWHEGYGRHFYEEETD